LAKILFYSNIGQSFYFLKIISDIIFHGHVGIEVKAHKPPSAGFLEIRNKYIKKHKLIDESNFV
jgi:hypothetical protein